MCKIGEQVERVLSLIKKENLLIILFDDFKKVTKKAYEKALKFLKIQSDNKNIFPHINVNTEPISKKLADILRSINRNRFHNRIFLYKKKIGIPDGVSIIRYMAILNQRRIKRGPLDPEFKKELQNYFKSDILLLQSIIDKDLSLWLE